MQIGVTHATVLNIELNIMGTNISAVKVPGG